MNSSNEKKSNFGQAALRVAAYIVLLNAVLSGCAGSLSTDRAGIVGESEIYDEIKVVGPVADLRRVRIRKRMQQVAGVSQATVRGFTGAPLSTSGVRIIPWSPIQISQFGRFPPASVQALDLPVDDSNSDDLLCRGGDSAC